MELKSPNIQTEAIFGNFDIMEKILGFLHEPGEGKVNGNPSSPSDASKKDLFSACLVSKSFFLDPALTILWRHLDSLLPVLRLFPTFQRDAESGNWSLRGTDRSDHLQRVLFYSRRIRSIRIVSPHTITDALTILSSRMQPVQPFLPLTELIIKIIPDNDIMHPILFIMPHTLTSIVIYGISSSSRAAVATLLQYLSSDHKSLKHLSLTGSLSDIFLTNLLEYTSLRSLTLRSSETPFSADYLKDLSESLTSLETLSFESLQDNEARTLNPSPIDTSFQPAAFFASLLNLTLTGDLFRISEILSVVKAPQLHEITLSFWNLIEVDTPDATTFAGCVAQVAEINGLEGKGNLQAVKISHNHPSTCIDVGAFDALYVLRTTIRVLHLQPNQLFIETEKEYKNPLESNDIYPNLVDLQISFHQSLPRHSAYYTPTVLGFLARTCPNLKTLHISIRIGKEDQIALKESKALDRANMPIHGLQTLVFRHLSTRNHSITLAVAFARYVNCIFPMLTSAEYLEKRLSADAEEWWTGVRDMLKMCQGEESGRRLHNLAKQ